MMARYFYCMNCHRTYHENEMGTDLRFSGPRCRICRNEIPPIDEEGMSRVINQDEQLFMRAHLEIQQSARQEKRIRELTSDLAELRKDRLTYYCPTSDRVLKEGNVKPRPSGGPGHVCRETGASVWPVTVATLRELVAIRSKNAPAHPAPAEQEEQTPVPTDTMPRRRSRTIGI
jgi:hypothetical protein